MSDVTNYYVSQLKKQFRVRLAFFVAFWVPVTILLFKCLSDNVLRLIAFLIAFMGYALVDEYIKERYLFKWSDVHKGLSWYITHEVLIVLAGISALIVALLDAVAGRRH